MSGLPLSSAANIPPSPAVAWAVIPAGGTGTRFSPETNKLLALLAGVPVLVRSLLNVIATPSIHGVVLVCHADFQADYQALIQQWLPHAPIIYALGGETRRDSVYQGLLAIPEDVPIVAVHDAARPLIVPEVIELAVQRVAQGHAGSLVAVPIQDTVKRVAADTLEVEDTLDRSLLWRAQTPQCFRKDLLIKAHQAVGADVSVTDDVQLLELTGLGPVVIVPGNERNLKITTPADILLAEAFLSASAGTLL